MNLSYTFVDSPVGRLKLVASSFGLVAILWENDNPKRVPLDETLLSEDQSILERTQMQLEKYFAGRILTLTQIQLEDYFAGKRRSFSVPLDARGTPFQKQVWRALLEIPFGETRSYGQLAEELGRPTAARAVGYANRTNPISIIVPCHRVIGASGELTGYAGGIDAKEHLLEFEGALPQRNLLLAHAQHSLPPSALKAALRGAGVADADSSPPGLLKA